MTRPLFGIETEYAVAALAPRGGAGLSQDLLELLMESARCRQVHLPQRDGHGIFLENGSRFYIDSGGHPELATPECTDPRELVRYVLAGEKILAGLVSRVESRLPEVESVMLLKTNVDYSGSRATWGCHESYLLRSDPLGLAEQIIPHLVSRLVYTGAGGFDSTAPGLEFTLSPRVHHLTEAISGDSTSGRAIFHTKDEPLAASTFYRLHLLCGESLCSERATWLKVGTTALVVAMLDAGLSPGKGWELSTPLQAMRAFAADPSGTAWVWLRGGRKATAVEIQLHYLEQAEAHLDAAFMPSWAREVSIEWRRTLDGLRSDPGSLWKRLDWAMKHRLYAHRAERKGLSWDSLRRWNRVAREISSEGVDTELGPPSKGSFWSSGSRQKALLKQHGLPWEEFERFLELRRELLEIDTRFGEVGPRGIYASIDRAGVLEHHLPDLGSVDAAVREPPSESRARLRGELIRRFASRVDCYCDWSSVLDFGSKRWADLSDPFELKEVWRKAEDWNSAAYPMTPPGTAAGSTVRIPLSEWERWSSSSARSRED